MSWRKLLVLVIAGAGLPAACSPPASPGPGNADTTRLRVKLDDAEAQCNFLLRENKLLRERLGEMEVMVRAAATQADELVRLQAKYDMLLKHADGLNRRYLHVAEQRDALLQRYGCTLRDPLPLSNPDTTQPDRP